MQEIKFKNYVDMGLENEVHKKLVREKFWIHMRDLNLNIKQTIQNKKVLLEDVARLNIELNRLNVEKQIPMIDMIVMIFENEYIPVRKFITILDSENMKILKKELRKLFKLKGSKFIDIDYLIN